MKKRVQTFDFDAVWKETHDGMKLIMSIYQGNPDGDFTVALWYDLYQKIYQWCTRPAEDKRKEELYHQTIGFFEGVVKVEEVELSKQRGEVLLKEYLKRYGNYVNGCKTIKKIFTYMHRYWIPSANTGGLADIIDMFDMARLKWRRSAYFPIKTRLFDALNDLATKDRMGELVDKSLIQKMVQAYIDIGVSEEQPVQFYKKEFQDPFVQATGEFYLKESTEFLQNNNVSAYMTKAEERLAQEEALAQNFLHPTSKDELIRSCKNALIERHNSVLQDEFQAWLRDDKLEDMKRFYNLLSRVKNGLDLSSATLKSYLTTVGKNVVEENSKNLDTRSSLKHSIQLVLEILKLYNKYTETIKHCFGNHIKFVQALDEACTSFINVGVGRSKKKKNTNVFTMAEVLNFYVDHLLKGGEKLSEDMLEEKLDQIVRLFTYFDDKDLFYGSFRRSLSKRLLGKKFNEDAERSFINKLKAKAGDVFTKKLEGMFNDIKVSQEREGDWKEYCRNLDNPPPVETTVAVLNNLYWPLQHLTDLTLPPQLAPSKDIFEKWYEKSAEKRKLSWIYNLGDCTLQYSFVDEKKRKKRIDLICTPVQATLLLAFNKSNKYRLKQLCEIVGCTPEHLKFCIFPLVYTKLRCLVNRGPEGKGKEKPASGPPSLADDDWLLVRPMSGINQRRVNIPPGVGVATSDRALQPVMEERALKIDLALVRVMKSRNSLQMQNLIAEASKQLLKFFRPDPRLMKKRIETLVERGFMRRDDEDQKTLHYCA
eukprot:TRINITY_DN10665_c0_g1_i1.p1 TRINITY_DN10665_c0_g1~~TRINITY_DN10665_c0_g1_i1.p1  ORF type:complete len:773 (+),score=222.39 TRINITY_DN10665_c0_g1_i1:28-2319(+)